MSQPRWRKVSAPAVQAPPMLSPLARRAPLPQGSPMLPGSGGRRTRGGGCGGGGGGGGGQGDRQQRSSGSSRRPEEHPEVDGLGCVGAAPAHALFLQHRGPKLPDTGVHEVSFGSGAEDDDALRHDHRRSSGDLQKAKTKKKSIGDKFSFLSRRSTDATSMDKASSGLRAIRPSTEQVQRWGVSFDSLLNDKYGLALFRAFLKTEYSDENIEFWIACEEYRNLVGPKKQTLKAQKIYSEFVAFQAPREVNLDSTTRLATINAMGSPDGHLFEQAQKRIQALMEKDSYQRFLRSEEYQGLLRDSTAQASEDGAHAEAKSQQQQQQQNSAANNS